MDILYKEILKSDLHENFFVNFKRYQEVEKIWRPDGTGDYELISEFHVEDWDEEKKKQKASFYAALLDEGGRLFGAFDGGELAGFSSIKGKFLEGSDECLQLCEFHVSHDYRGKKIGKKLFSMCAGAARERGCKRIYIVASPAENSQKAYQKIGCVFARPPDARLYEKNPNEVHMEYFL